MTFIDLAKKVYASAVKYIWRNKTKNYEDNGDAKMAGHSIHSLSSWGVGKSANSVQSTSNRNNLGDYNVGTNFTIYNAIGGKIVQIVSYDSKTDRTNSNLYLIMDNEDFGEQLAMIVTRNNLSK